MKGNHDIERIRADFIEKIGIVAQGEGLPRIAGRIFALLVFDGVAVSFSDLAVRLQVSRASVSSSVRLLEMRGLIKRSAKAGERQDYFQLAESPYSTMLEGARQRTVRAKAEIDATVAELPETAPDVRARLERYAGFYGAIDAGLAQAIDRIAKTGA